MRVSNRVIAILDRATTQGNSLSLAAIGRIDRSLYAETNRVLEAAGGKWNRKAKAHLFEGDAAEAIEPVILTGAVVGVRRKLQQFDTPPDLARRVIAEARIEPGMFVLEPSAGLGALADAAADVGGGVTCFEVDQRRAFKLSDSGRHEVTCCDFLGVPPSPIYHRVLMNPPFTRGQDIRHVLHAWRFLKPGGRLVAIMSAGFTFRNRDIDMCFRDDLQRVNAAVEMLPEGAFKAAGTAVRTCLVTIGGR